MTINKLQKVATSHVDASLKGKWLQWWNSPVKVKTKNKFPSALPLSEKVLKNWLNKVSFRTQMHPQLLFLYLFIPLLHISNY